MSVTDRHDRERPQTLDDIKSPISTFVGFCLVRHALIHLIAAEKEWPIETRRALRTLHFSEALLREELQEELERRRKDDDGSLRPSGWEREYENAYRRMAEKRSKTIRGFLESARQRWLCFTMRCGYYNNYVLSGPVELRHRAYHIAEDVYFEQRCYDALAAGAEPSLLDDLRRLRDAYRDAIRA